MSEGEQYEFNLDGPKVHIGGLSRVLKAININYRDGIVTTSVGGDHFLVGEGIDFKKLAASDVYFEQTGDKSVTATFVDTTGYIRSIIFEEDKGIPRSIWRTIGTFGQFRTTLDENRIEPQAKANI